jgi:hypothetical protein
MEKLYELSNCNLYEINGGGGRKTDEACAVVAVIIGSAAGAELAKTING